MPPWLRTTEFGLLGADIVMVNVTGRWPLGAAPMVTTALNVAVPPATWVVKEAVERVRAAEMLTGAGPPPPWLQLLLSYAVSLIWDVPNPAPCRFTVGLVEDPEMEATEGTDVVQL